MRVKGKIIIALLISFISLILCFILEEIILFYTWDSVYDDYKDYLLLFSFFVFPFCVAYIGFCLCYSGKLYVKIKDSALIVPALFGIIPIVLIAFPRYIVYDTCCRASPIDSIVAELNGRENLRWADIKVSGLQFQTDAEIDEEIVFGKTHGGWDTDLGADYTWTVAPTATGGTISFQSGKGVALYRAPATLEEEAKWSTRRRVPLLPVTGHYTCTEVESGDTIIFIKNGSKARIKLLGIDAPQVPFCKNEPGQPFSRESAEYLAEMILNKKVKIVLYGIEGEGRSKGVVFVESKNVNLEMIKAGLAEVDRRRRFPGFDLEPYINSETEARKAGLGMWSLGDCYLSPWDWETDWRARERALACE